METSTLLKANIKHKKGAFISVMILTLLIVTTAAAVLGVSRNYSSAMERAVREADAGNTVVLINRSRLEDGIIDRVRKSSLVEKAETRDVIVNSDKTVYPELSDGNSYFFAPMISGLKLYTPELDGFEDSIPELQAGEIYLPSGLYNKMGARVGDVISTSFYCGKREFTVKGFLQDPAYGASMIGWKRVFISRSDYEALERDLLPFETENRTSLMEEVTITKADKTQSDAKFQRELNLETDIVSRSAGSLTLEQSKKYTGLFMDIVLDVVLGFVGLLFVIVLVIIAHSIRTEIEMDYVNLGILKAQGFTNRKITLVIMLRYFFAELAGVILGAAAAIPIERMLSGIFHKVTGILPDSSFAFLGTAATVGGIFLLSALLILFCTRRLSRISPVRAISGGREEIYFSSRFTAPITKRGLTASIAYRSFSSAVGKYMGILFITALLTFFTVTVNVMSGAIGSRQALENMGMFFGDISVRVTKPEGVDAIPECERIAEKYSPIEKKIYASGIYFSVEGENIMCEVWKDPEIIPGVLKGRRPIYDNEILITQSVGDALELKMGDKVKVSGRASDAQYIITGIYQTGSDAGYCFAMSFEGAKRIGMKSISDYEFVLADTSRIDDIAAEINESFGDMLTATAYRFEDNIYNDTLMVAARAMRVMIYAFSGVFALVAVIMVCSKAFMQERRDLGIYKAMGFTSGQLRRQFAVRFLLISLIGSIIGGLAGGFFSADILNLIFSLFGITKIQTASTPLTFITAAAFVCISTALFAYITSHRIKRIEVRELITE
ncbi:MAG: FtsX-like permease family protein [Ruminococcus sp.]|nr:FtsX-like permease family protein [Ruminococcus sp.]